jgi:hypothetical protein
MTISDPDPDPAGHVISDLDPDPGEVKIYAVKEKNLRFQVEKSFDHFSECLMVFN